MLYCVVWNSGGWARACWHYAIPVGKSVALAQAKETEIMGYKQVEIIPAWAARHWCYLVNCLNKADNTKGEEKEKWSRIAVAVEKWLITRAKRPENQE